ncbi:hypothetical protein ES703_87125 [subsurface metagenome]
MNANTFVIGYVVIQDSKVGDSDISDVDCVRCSLGNIIVLNQDVCKITRYEVNSPPLTTYHGVISNSEPHKSTVDIDAFAEGVARERGIRTVHPHNGVFIEFIARYCYPGCRRRNIYTNSIIVIKSNYVVLYYCIVCVHEVHTGCRGILNGKAIDGYISGVDIDTNSSWPSTS